MSLCIVQVRLSSARDFDGGELLFVTEDGLVATSKAPGSATLHDSAIAHGWNPTPLGFKPWAV